ncbi:class I SAM-dependent methyltransferase [Streptomyces sporangiiformans]|uniref:Class I SAM-dependent methyltransferase n=1 Tax=Streptomyces sporangiiformans TaxID=2315329 RepID=A0A505CYX5_9ACTN|nr:class I SAM-dependent methyltransferase [Streptomyces sporangiiformans]TPQ15637.1 class I SAM-dependent methyltransferase [Streptomyces sporangiiformans]
MTHPTDHPDSPTGTTTPHSADKLVNSQQATAWNGYEGRHWADHQDRYDGINDGANTPLLDAAALAPSDRVLDIGCGNGRVTRLAAGRAAYALGIDLSAPMLERARASATAESLGNVDFVQADAQVYGFAEAAFDAAVSRFGIMFFADPVEGFGNIGRALRPGGRLAFVCPQSFDRMEQSTVFAAISEHVRLPDLSQSTGPSPLAFADPDHTRRVLADAGFDDVTVEDIEVPQYWGKDAEDAAGFLFGLGPLRHWLREADADSRTEERAHQAAVHAFRPYQGDGGVRLMARYWLVTAVRP